MDNGYLLIICLSIIVHASNAPASPILFPEFELATEPEEKDAEQNEGEDEENGGDEEQAENSGNGAHLADGEPVMRQWRHSVSAISLPGSDYYSVWLLLLLLLLCLSDLCLSPTAIIHS